MEQKKRKCLVCGRDVDSSWDDLIEHLLSRDDVSDDVREAIKSEEYWYRLGHELYFTEIQIPIEYARVDDREVIDTGNEPQDPAFNYFLDEVAGIQWRVPKEKIKHTNLTADLCYICSNVLQHIHNECVSYTDSVIEDDCLHRNSKLIAEITVKEVDDSSN